MPTVIEADACFTREVVCESRVWWSSNVCWEPVSSERYGQHSIIYLCTQSACWTEVGLGVDERWCSRLSGPCISRTEPLQVPGCMMDPLLCASSVNLGNKERLKILNRLLWVQMWESNAPVDICVVCKKQEWIHSTPFICNWFFESCFAWLPLEAPYLPWENQWFSMCSTTAYPKLLLQKLLFYFPVAEHDNSYHL